jgi:hypothetical protein
MTFPLYLAVHLVYGALMAWVMERRLRSEGEVLGVPLVVTLVPVAFVSAPVGAIFVRWAGGWFLHGAFLANGAYVYERFHLGIMIGVAFLAGVSTVFGMFVTIAFLSRESKALASIPFGLAGVVLLVFLILDGSALVSVRGSGEMVWSHPVGLLTVGQLAVLGGAIFLGSRHLSEPLQRNV